MLILICIDCHNME